jgi:hypothetical protein
MRQRGRKSFFSLLFAQSTPAMHAHQREHLIDQLCVCFEFAALYPATNVFFPLPEEKEFSFVAVVGGHINNDGNGPALL